MNEEQLAWIKSLIRDELDRVFMPELKALQAEIVRLTLTDAEREAIRFFSLIDGPGNVPVANKRAATLRGLLERMK